MSCTMWIYFPTKVDWLVLKLWKLLPHCQNQHPFHKTLSLFGEANHTVNQHPFQVFHVLPGPYIQTFDLWLPNIVDCLSLQCLFWAFCVCFLFLYSQAQGILVSSAPVILILDSAYDLRFSRFDAWRDVPYYARYTIHTLYKNCNVYRATVRTIRHFSSNLVRNLL